MSRIGKMPVPILSGVDVGLEGQTVSVNGPRGQLSLDVHPDMTVIVEDGEVRVTRPSDGPEHRSLHGLTRSLIANMVEGVSSGFQRTLEIIGVGYRADMKGKGITLTLGFSHTIDYQPPEGVSIELPNQTTVVVQGADKQKVGQTAAEIRSFRPPEPYKGKGIRYKGEQVRRKAGKTAGA